MLKRFYRCYSTVNGTSVHNQEIAIETDGTVGDWYSKIYTNSVDFIIKHDYRTNDYISELIVYDVDSTLYHNVRIQQHLFSRGVYLKYVRNNLHPDGMWYGQYPQHAWNCCGIWYDDIEDLIEHLKKDPHYCPIRHDGLGDLISTILYPDSIINGTQDVNASIVPNKKVALDTIDDAIQAFEILNMLNIDQLYGQIPQDYIDATYNIIKRLSDVRVWVDNSTVKIR